MNVKVRIRLMDDGTPVKQCTLCWAELPLTSFHRERKTRDGRTQKCMGCRRKLSGLRYRQKRDEILAKESKLRRERRRAGRGRKADPNLRAYWAVYEAIARGDMERPDRCSRCLGTGGPIQGHHRDYAKPLEVTWLCVRCHNDVHKEERALREMQSGVAGRRWA